MQELYRKLFKKKYILGNVTVRKDQMIVHITTKDDWATAEENGEYWAKSLKVEGFIHCSRPEQIVTTANRFFHGCSNLLILCIDRNKVKSQIRDESADNDIFPHIYGTLNTDAVVRVIPFVPNPDGSFSIPEELQGML